MTIKDIARISGVSITTVSRVLNDRPDVSDESRRRVLDVIESTNYIPNNSARDLVKTRSDSFGLVVRGPPLWSGKNGCGVLCCWADGSTTPPPIWRC